MAVQFKLRSPPYGIVIGVEGMISSSGFAETFIRDTDKGNLVPGTNAKMSVNKK